MSDRTLAFVDSESFASIMRRLPGGVSVVTTRDQGGAPCGLTSTAISSVSADPPLLLVCVALTSRTLPALRESRGFVVHFMDQTSVAACVTFASKADDKFAGLEWEETPSGLPRLCKGVAGWAECELYQELPAGDHVILIGRVVDGAAETEATSPLVYHDRAFGRWSAID